MIAPSANPLLPELSDLPPESLLATQGTLAVYLARAPQIPSLLREIGRLREIAFRAVGEGTGRELDLDRFDEHYSHLFLWDRQHQQIAGAYRLAATDEVLAHHGPSGLYCSTLFEFEEPFLEQLTPALELGRSFVTPAYQKSLAPLLALWKGIASYVARRPSHYRLFGPVSISQDYTMLSQNLLVQFLRENKWNRELGPLVHPLNPFSSPPEISPHLENIEQVSAQIAQGEGDGRGMPVLLRQYLKLNATLLEFNRDPAFSNCLDALLLVNLHDAPPAILSRYMGKAAYEQFRRLPR